MSKLQSLLPISLGLGLLLGCAGSSDVDSGDSSLVLSEALLSAADPIPAALWQAAPASCEGRLEAHVSFRAAAGADGLFAAITPDGQVLCVDSVASLRVELSQETADSAPAPTVDPVSSTSIPIVGLTYGDPNPQPNVQPMPSGNGGPKADPTPQPNMQPRPSGT